MGYIVSVCSNIKKQGKTLFLYNLVKKLNSLCTDETKILLVCLNSFYGNIFELFGIKADLMIEEVIALKSNEEIDFIKAMPSQKNIYFLSSKTLNNNRLNKDDYADILEKLKTEFNCVFVDTVSGHDNPLTQKMLEISDYTINVIQQDIKLLDSYSPRTKDNFLHVVNNYKNIYPSSKELGCKYGLGNNIYTLPSCDVLQEMKNKDKLEYYQQVDTVYNKNLNEIALYVIRELGLELKVKETGKRHGILKMFGVK
jgi:hypothetical protein